MQTLCANILLEQFVQTVHANSLCEEFVQGVPPQLWAVSSLRAWAVHSKSLCKTRHSLHCGIGTQCAGSTESVLDTKSRAFFGDPQRR